MKFTIEDEYGKYEIESKKKDADIHEMMNYIERLLYSMSFGKRTIDDGFLSKAEEIQDSQGEES